jgi:hypothetical protein
MLLNTDKESQPGQSSHLFTLRFWLEDLGNNQFDWRGRIQHVNSGEVIYFRNCEMLEAFIEGWLNKSKEQGLTMQAE